MVLVEPRDDVALDIPPSRLVVHRFGPVIGRPGLAGLTGAAAETADVHPRQQLRFGSRDGLQRRPCGGLAHDGLRATMTGRDEVMCSASWPPCATGRPPIRMSPTTNPSSAGTSYCRRSTAPGRPRVIRQ